MVPDWLKHPRWKAVRPPLGVLLILLGCLGFLPVLGFWMIPLGVAVLAVDVPAAKRAESWMIETWRNALARWRDWRGS